MAGTSQRSPITIAAKITAMPVATVLCTRKNSSTGKMPTHARKMPISTRPTRSRVRPRSSSRVVVGSDAVAYRAMIVTMRARDDEREVEGQRGCLVAHAERAEVLLPPLRVAGAQHRGERADHEERREHEREQHRREVHRRQERHVGGEGEGDAREDRAGEREHDGADEALLEHVGQADPAEQRDDGVRDRERRDVEPVQAGARHVEPGRRVVRAPPGAGAGRSSTRPSTKAMSAVTAPPMPTYSPSEPGPEIASSRPQNATNETAPPDDEERRPEEQRDRLEGLGTGGRMPQHPGDRRRFGPRGTPFARATAWGRSRRPRMPVAVPRVHGAAQREGPRSTAQPRHPLAAVGRYESVGSSTSSIEPCTKPAHSYAARR